jgi:predicted AlkP superfamily phosphohydrolase/phosphomutase
MTKVIVIGLDGFEPKIAEAMMGHRELPNLARLREQGGYARLKTTYPAQTPVAWSTFSTGTNPGGHGIFDFLGRDPKTYLPLLALSRYEQKNAFVPPKVVNQRRGTPIWKLLSDAGIPSVVIRCPCTYPPDEINGRMLAGVGVPDLRGGLGTSTYYSTTPGIIPSNSEKFVQLTKDGNGVYTTHLIGPRDPRTRSDFKVEIKLQHIPEAGKVIIHSEGEPTTLEIKPGQWSKWLKIKFKIGMLQSVRGEVRFFLRRIEPEFEFYASPINFDPEAPLFPISSPAKYATELQSRLGPYYTIGMAEDHDGLINGRFDETAYLAQCADVMRERERMMLYELERFREGFFFCLFDTPDRLQHIFWRFGEPDHPANRDGLNSEMKSAITDHYRNCDAVVGKAMQYADDQTLFIALSDHGMNSFRRGLNINTWLYQNGFLGLKNGVKPGAEAGDFFQNVDWTRTKAYALGLGGIYLNVKGREESGIVVGQDAEQVKSNLIKGLTGLVDTERRQQAVTSVLAREQIYHGLYTSEAPDLLVNFTAGYRVSWDTPLGGVPEKLFEDNIKKWGGDHVIDPSLVPGVLWMNQGFRGENPSLVDLAPTILAALAVPKGAEMEGTDLRA